MAHGDGNMYDVGGGSSINMNHSLGRPGNPVRNSTAHPVTRMASVCWSLLEYPIGIVVVSVCMRHGQKGSSHPGRNGTTNIK